MNITSGSSPSAIATALVSRLQAAGHAAFWAGGCVRDLLLKKEPHDYDIATSALPEQIEALFAHTVPVGRQFGVLLVNEAGCQFQIATLRAEADYKDGRHPERVTFSNAQADASRRDFTINGLFYDPVSDRLFDWVQGEADLRAKCIRAIGEPAARFAEDHLRLLRAVRFAAQLDFQIEANTMQALRQFAAKILAVSSERIREELLKLFRPPHAARGLELLRASGLLALLLPELDATIGCDQSPDYHPEGAVYDHVKLMLEHLPPDASPSLPWAVLLHDIGKPPTAERHPATGAIHFYGHEKTGADMASAVLRRLRFPRRQIDEIAACVRYHMQFKDVPYMRKATLRRLLMRQTFPLELALFRLDCIGSHQGLEVYNFLIEQTRLLANEPQLQPPLITGNDLLAMGMAPGPTIGVLLAEIRDKQLQDELRTADQARAWAMNRIAQLQSAAQKTSL